MKKNNTNLILIISITSLVLAFSILIYFLNVIRSKNNYISVAVSTLEKKMNEKENIKFLKDKISELSDTYKKINSYFVDTSSIDTFVVYLEGIGTDNNVDLSVKGVDASRNEKNKISVNLSMKGNFSDIMNVVNILENAPYNITINSLYLNKDIILPNNPIKENISSWQADVTFNVLSL
ncbi:MAG: hypothetical protein WCW54_04085 [Candidatus Paceibacterota bacterium]